MNQDRKDLERGVAQTIKLHAFRRIVNSKTDTRNLYVGKNVLRRGQNIHAGHTTIPIERDTAFVFSDDAPLFNWAHPCRYLLYNSKNGEFYKEVQASFPPDLVEENRSLEAFHKPVEYMASKPFRLYERADWAAQLGKIQRLRQGKRYAVLYSGASNNRHTNDLEFMYRTLIDVYGFDPTRIYVLNYDGTVDYSGGPHPVGNWPGDDTPYRIAGNVTAAGTKAEFENVFDDLKTRLTSRDMLYIHTNNHGGHNGESYLCTYSGVSYGASDFADKLAELPTFAKLMVMMEQCHSGGFNQPITDASPAVSTSVASACEENRSSIGGPEFDPFARDWIAAMTGVNPYGAALVSNPDTDGNSVIGAAEAFDYAMAVKDPYDTPVYDDTPVGCGNTMHLGELPAYFLVKRIHDYIRQFEPKELEPPLPEPGPDPWFMIRDIQQRIPLLVRAMEATTPKAEWEKMVPASPERELAKMMGKATETTLVSKKLDELREPLNQLVEAFNELEHTQK